MKDGFLKIATAAPKIRLADTGYNASLFADLAISLAKSGVKLVAFPELAITGATLGDVFRQSSLVRAAEEALGEFVKKTAECEILSFIGLPVLSKGRLYAATAAVLSGKILGVYAKSDLTEEEKRCFFGAPEENETVELCGMKTVLGSKLIFESVGAPGLRVAVQMGSEANALSEPALLHIMNGANLIVHPSSFPERVSGYEEIRAAAAYASKKYLSAYALANAGVGESGTDAVYSGFSIIAETGSVLKERQPFSENNACIAVIDTEKIAAERTLARRGEDACGDYDYIEFSISEEETELTEPPRMTVFVPEDRAELDKRCRLIFDIQANALAERARRAGAASFVLGVSGGLDSTLAILVAKRAAELLLWEPSAVKAVTMPCFGTTVRTRGNAERLSEELGAELRTIDIKAAVNQHFSDISHSADKVDVVFENSQARERTQILMDLANALSGMVVGTGDLSELALGFATYNGDHMSMYGVNAAVPKTLMRAMVLYLASLSESEGKTALAEVLRDIVNTPVSPELTPPKDDGEIAQCTESIVGPYELNDYFLYFLTRYGFSPRKILCLATASFAGKYDREYILGWLRVFLRRFFSQQFKRSCLPDGPGVGSVSLSPRAGFKMPSDMASKIWLDELK